MCRNDVESGLEVCLEVLRREVQNLPEFAASAFRPLAILDIDTRSIPFDNLSALVAEGYFMMQHPAILPVCPPHTRLELQRLAAREAGPPPRDEPGHVVWVDRRRPFPALEILQSQSHKLEPALVEEIQVPVGETRVDQRGKGIDEHP